MNTAIRVIGCVFMLLSLAACDFCLYSEEFFYAGIMLICALVFFIIVCCVRKNKASVALAGDSSQMYSEAYNSSKLTGRNTADTTAADVKRDSKKSRKTKAYSQPWRDADDSMPERTSPSAYMTGASFTTAAGEASFAPAVRPSSSGANSAYASTAAYSSGYYSAGQENEGAFSANQANSDVFQNVARPSEAANSGIYHGGNISPDSAKGYFTQMPGSTPPTSAARPAMQAAFPSATAGVKYMRYCKECGFLGSQLATESVPPCPTCGAKLFASDVPLSEFTMLDQRKRSALMRKWSKAV